MILAGHGRAEARRYRSREPRSTGQVSLAGVQLLRGLDPPCPWKEDAWADNITYQGSIKYSIYITNWKYMSE